MKIGFITPSFTLNEERVDLPFLFEIAKKVSERHEVHVYAMHHPPMKSQYKLGNINIYPFDGQRPKSVWKRMKLWYDVLQTIRYEHRKSPFDIFHALWVNEPGFLGVLASKILHAPLVASVCGGELVSMPDLDYGTYDSLPHRLMTKLTFHNAAKITVSSSLIQNICLQKFPQYQHKIIFLPFGIDVNRFCPLEKRRVQNNGFNVLTVGWLNHIKNQKLLIDAVAKAKKQIPTIHLRIVGEGILENELKNYVHSLNLDDTVSLTGRIAWHKLPEIYQNADVFSLTSLHEGQAMVILEAGASGLPIISTPVGSAVDLNGAAILVQPNNSGELASALVRLFFNEEERLKKANDVLQLVKERFTLEKCVEELLTCYGSLVNKSDRQ